VSVHLSLPFTIYRRRGCWLEASEARMGDTSPSCSSADQKRDREKTASGPAQMGGTILLYLGNASKEGLYLGARIQQFLTCNFCVDH